MYTHTRAVLAPCQIQILFRVGRGPDGLDPSTLAGRAPDDETSDDDSDVEEVEQRNVR